MANAPVAIRSGDATHGLVGRCPRHFWSTPFSWSDLRPGIVAMFCVLLLLAAVRAAGRPDQTSGAGSELPIPP